MKLLAGVGGFLGQGEIWGALAAIAVLGAAFALGAMIRRGVLPLLLYNTVNLVRSLSSLGRAEQRQSLDSPAALTVPYGVPIAVATLIWWFWNGVRV